MPTLNAMFKLMDGYSSQIKKIVEGTDKASKSILGASKRTDDFNGALKRTEIATSRANNGLSRLVKTASVFAFAKKGMDLTDMYTSTNARLGMITETLAEQKSLQNDIFAAANRARGSYTDMANSAAKMRMLAGDSFGSNQEAIAFTELLTKTLKVSGTGRAEQNSAFLQLTQAMAAGRLQGDEFRSIMENAPMVANAIADYMGKSKGELKELSSQGLITADIVKNAMFQAAGDIEARFSSMPMTFADVWQKIKNAGMQAFGGVFEKISATLNSDMGQAAVENLTGLVFMAAGAFSALLDAIGWVGDRLDIFGPMILGIAGAWVVYNATAGIGWLTTMKNVAAMGLKVAADCAEYKAIFMLIWAQEGFNAALAACPITWIVGGIVLLISLFYAGIAAMNRFAGTNISATGLIVGAFFAAGALIGNLFIAGWNFLVGILTDIANICISFAEFFANFLNDPVLAIMNLIANLANFVIGVMSSLAKVIDSVFGLKLTEKVDGWADSVNRFREGIKQDNTVTYDRIDKASFQFDRIGYKDAFHKGYGMGDGFADKTSNLFSGFNQNLGNSSGFDYSQFATGGNPAVVKGTGKGGAVKVEAEREDIEWMRKLAERDYVARISQNTLAPNIKVEFSGPITKEADTDSVMTHVVKELKDIIATAPEGVPT